MLISAFSAVYIMKTRRSYPLLPIVSFFFFFCLVLALRRVWHNNKWFVWASSQAPVPLHWMLLSMESRGLLVSVPLTQCGETKGHDRCQDRGPDLLSVLVTFSHDPHWHLHESVLPLWIQEVHEWNISVLQYNTSQCVHSKTRFKIWRF